MLKRVLMIAYHFPPLAGSSGIQRTLRFVQHLPSFGWQSVVLSAHPRAYERTSKDLESEVPEGTIVRRAFALDTARHLAIGARYFAAMARPDRWVSWKFDAVRQGMQMIRDMAPCVIWSTYPIATAHLIGAELHRRSGIPWIADFRDPMAQDGYPEDPLTHRGFLRIEEVVARNAAWCTFTTPSAARMYRERYPFAADRIVGIENGYDEESFAFAERLNAGGIAPLNPGFTTLLHSGIVYPSERDPGPLFEALGRLRERGLLEAAKVRIRFRAAVHDELLRTLAARHAVERWVEICAPLGYQAALQEMLRAEALLLMQGANCKEQIPAKAYEYLRARRPILCLSAAGGDTAAMLHQAGISSVASLESADQIEAAIPSFLQSVRDGSAQTPADDVVQMASRTRRSEALAKLLNVVVS